MTNVHTDIEVLRTEIGSLRTNVSEVAAKMDMLLAMQVQLVGLQKDIEHTRASVDRAFDALRVVRAKADSNEVKLTSTISMGRGAFVVGAVLVAAIQWWVLQQIAEISTNTAALHAVDRRLGYVEQKLWPDSVGGK